MKPTRLIVAASSAYAVRLAAGPADVQAVQALRFTVFNLELHEGLQESYATGLDSDPFDAVCDHLLVEHTPSRAVVGTYRFQTGACAARNLGYYSAQEFDFTPFESARPQILELGRACVEQNHRNLAVLGLLWKGIAEYCRRHGCRYLMGCSSLTSQDARVGASMYNELYRKHLTAPEWRTRPLPHLECPIEQLAPEHSPVPKLLRAYLSIGAKICGPPAIDRAFKTIDFLTFLDLETLTDDVRKRFLE